MSDILFFEVKMLAIRLINGVLFVLEMKNGQCGPLEISLVVNVENGKRVQGFHAKVFMRCMASSLRYCMTGCSESLFGVPSK